MGWFGYGIYDGDGTQTCHYDFFDWAKIRADIKDGHRRSDYFGEFLTTKGTILPKEDWDIFVKNINLVLKKMPKSNYKSQYIDMECSAIEWQMLLSLFVDNKTKAPEIVYKNGIEATKFLMGEHASDFDKPSVRRKTLKNFIVKAEKNQFPLMVVKLPGKRERWLETLYSAKEKVVEPVEICEEIAAISSIKIEDIFDVLISKLNNAFSKIEAQDIEVNEIEMSQSSLSVFSMINQNGKNKFIKRGKIWAAKIKIDKKMKFGQIRVRSDIEGIEISL